MPANDLDLQRRVWRELRMFHEGPARAVTKKQLARVLDARTRDIEYAVQALRRNGHPIGSSCTSEAKGYFVARYPDELQPTLAQLTHRLGEQQRTLSGLSRAFQAQPGTLFS